MNFVNSEERKISFLNNDKIKRPLGDGIKL